MPEDEVLVVLDAALAVEVDVEELAVVQRLRDAGREVEPRHLLVPDLGVEADELGVLQLVDERERVTDGREQDVAARLVRLRLDREADAVALVEHVLAEQVDGLLVAGERGAHVLRGVVLRAFAATPHHERLGAEFGGEVDLPDHLAERVAAHGAVVGGEPAILEDGRAEEVGGDHRDSEPGRLQGGGQPVDGRSALGLGRSEGEQVVVVEGEPVGPSSASFSTAWTASRGARVGPPKGSAPL